MSATGRGPRLGGADDFYETPAWCVHRLLEAWHPPGGRWVEPAAGEGAIISAANDVRSDVRWTAIEKRPECRPRLCSLGYTLTMDYLAWDSRMSIPGVAVVIGNPPFKHALEFIQESQRYFPGADVCMLLRLNFYASKRRHDFMVSSNPSILLLPNRPSFANRKTDSCEYAWFLWSPHIPGGTIQPLALTPLAERRSVKK